MSDTLIASIGTENSNHATYVGGLYNQQTGFAVSLSSSWNITSVKFYLKGYDLTGTLAAYIYACTGTPGSGAYQTGSALATSESMDLSDIIYERVLYEFNFSPAYSVSAGNIVIVLDPTNENKDFSCYYDDDTCGPNTNMCSKNYSGTVGGSSTANCIFYLYGTPGGWSGGDLNGVANASLGKINGVELSDISKINGVE